MNKIIRTPTRAEGGVTLEEKARLDEVSAFWIANAMRTDRADLSKLAPAIHGMYEAAGLKKPRVVLVPSPIVMAAAYGASAAIWYERKNGKPDSATYSATYSATDNATRIATRIATRSATARATDSATESATESATYRATESATYRATESATESAIHIATRDATDSATYSATRSATRDATESATESATYRATRDATDNATDRATRDAARRAARSATVRATVRATRRATRSATDAMGACYELSGDLGLACAKRWWSVYQGGNMWSYWCAYLSGARDVLGLRLPEHDSYAHFEQAALNGGFRVMHEEFCIVSDFPEILRVDENNDPHCENGPSHRWRDGWELYHWHGVRVPGHWIMSPETVDPAEVLGAKNVEERAAGIAIIGMAKMFDRLEHQIIDSDPDPMHGDLIRVTLPDLPEPAFYLSAHCPRNGRIMEAVNPAEMDEMTVRGAQAWRLGIPASEFIFPTVRT